MKIHVDCYLKRRELDGIDVSAVRTTFVSVLGISIHLVKKTIELGDDN